MIGLTKVCWTMSKKEVVDNSIKIEYLRSSFDNVQSLIQFADQKIGNLLLIDTITVGIFITYATNYELSLKDLTVWNILLFITGLIFTVSSVILVYKSIIKVVKPRFARNYTTGAFSLYYFGHIGTVSKEKVITEVAALDENKMITELTEQLYEVSKILNRKYKECEIISVLMFVSVICFVLFIVISAFL